MDCPSNALGQNGTHTSIEYSNSFFDKTNKFPHSQVSKTHMRSCINIFVYFIQIIKCLVIVQL
jgi:hypothetical protein